MKKYICITRTYGFQGRLWEVGSVAEVDDNVIPPKWFVPEYEAQLVEKVPTRDDPMKPKEIFATGALSQLPQSPNLKGGMAASMEGTEQIADNRGRMKNKTKAVKSK